LLGSETNDILKFSSSWNPDVILLLEQYNSISIGYEEALLKLFSNLKLNSYLTSAVGVFLNLTEH